MRYDYIEQAILDSGFRKVGIRTFADADDDISIKVRSEGLDTRLIARRGRQDIGHHLIEHDSDAGIYLQAFDAVTLLREG